MISSALPEYTHQQVSVLHKKVTLFKQIVKNSAFNLVKLNVNVSHIYEDSVSLQTMPSIK